MLRLLTRRKNTTRLQSLARAAFIIHGKSCPTYRFSPVEHVIFTFNEHLDRKLLLAKQTMHRKQGRTPGEFGERSI
jgi:hypothetical protein